MKNPVNVLITGASSGIGAALALAYAAPGVRLSLGGRDQVRLDAVADAARARGAEVTGAVVDVTDAEAMASWITTADAVGALDLVIANAGISGGTSGGDEQTRAIFTTNVNGILNTVLPVIPLMKTRRRGQIALMSSLAGYRGLPSAPAYAASKAAVTSWGEGLRGWLHADGVEVSVICPGYVTTPMTNVNTFYMPFLMSVDRASAIIRHGLARNQGHIAFPWPMAVLMWLISALPNALVDPMLRQLPTKR